ncbi:UNVERIFIED_CONTAM: hypothetical protein FKN15_000821 [Acipenser sinensis]
MRFDPDGLPYISDQDALLETDTDDSIRSQGAAAKKPASTPEHQPHGTGQSTALNRTAQHNTVASSSPGYSFADRGWELPGGGAQLAERCPGWGGSVRSARVSLAHHDPATPVVGLACKLPKSCIVLRRCSSWVAAW